MESESALRQIGDVAEEVGLSLRTIRYYGEVGLVPPSDHTHGGFRLYTDQDVRRLLLIKHMKPLDFTLEEIGEALGILDDLKSDLPRAKRAERSERLRQIVSLTQERVTQLSKQLRAAKSLIETLTSEVGD